MSDEADAAAEAAEDALEGELPVALSTALPASVPSLPGAFTSASLNSKIEAATAAFKPGVNGFEAGVRVEDNKGEVTIKALFAVKISEGWAVYGEGAMDLHGNKSAELGIKGTF